MCSIEEAWDLTREEDEAPVSEKVDEESPEEESNLIETFNVNGMPDLLSVLAIGVFLMIVVDGLVHRQRN